MKELAGDVWVSLVTIGEVCEFVLDGTSRFAGSGGRPVFRFSVLRTSSAVRSVLRRIASPAQSEFSSFARRAPSAVGDVLLTIVGTIGRVGGRYRSTSTGLSEKCRDLSAQAVSPQLAVPLPFNTLAGTSKRASEFLEPVVPRGIYLGIAQGIQAASSTPPRTTPNRRPAGPRGGPTSPTPRRSREARHAARRPSSLICLEIRSRTRRAGLGFAFVSFAAASGRYCGPSSVATTFPAGGSGVAVAQCPSRENPT